jgi:hypothetical protein
MASLGAPSTKFKERPDMSTTNQERDRQSEPDAAVGYGKPPQASRFKKGISGNPTGRPKGSRNVAAVFARTLQEKVIINENGQRRTITKLEAAVKQFVNQAASGNLRALQMLVAFARDAETRENLSLPTESIIGEVDQRVIEGIIRRFQPLKQVEGATNEEPQPE